MESAGARLKKIRLEKGLSMEEVQKRTKIHLNILKAIEEDSLINFSPIYIKGFLKIYCKFLNANPRDYIPDYKEPQNITKYTPEAPVRPKPLFKMPSLNIFSLKAIHIKPKIIFVSVLILVFIISLFKLGKIISSNHIIFSSKKKMPVVASSQLENKSTITKLQGLASLKIIRLDISAKENCFVRVKSDGRVIFQNILRMGMPESWQAENKIELSLGNAGAVEIEVNGKRMPPLGKRGQSLKNILITREGLSIKR